MGKAWENLALSPMREEAGLSDSAGSSVLYDLTNTHCEESGRKSSLVHPGKDKQERKAWRPVA